MHAVTPLARRSRQIRSRRPHRGVRWYVPFSQQGSMVLPAAVITGLVLVIGAVAMAERGLSSRLGASYQNQSRESEQVADSGLAVVISELNREPNRALLEATVPINAWGESNNATAIRNPCANGRTPDAQTMGFSSEANPPTIAKNPNHRFIVKRYTIKNKDRNKTYTSTSSGANISGSNLNGFSPIADINLADAANVGYVELEVEGQVLRDGKVIARTLLTREYQLVPKCCKQSFGEPTQSHGNDYEACDLIPPLLVGTASLFGPGGGVTLASPSSELRLYDSSNALLDQKPSQIICLTGTGTCGGKVNSVDGVPVMPLKPFIPNLLPYPGTTSICRSAINPVPGTQNCGNNGYGGLIIDATDAADEPGKVLTVCVDENNDGTLTAKDVNCPAAFSSSSPPQIANKPSTTATLEQVKTFAPYRGYWAKGFDTMRVSPEGVVQLCNTRNENANNTEAEPILSQVLVGGTAACADISRFCYRSDYTPPDGSPIQRAYHCRIRQLIVNDDTQTASSPAGGNESLRRQNNTFTIDTTGDPIYLYFNDAWKDTKRCDGVTNGTCSGTLTGPGISVKYGSENKLTQVSKNSQWVIDDGQIQHVRCEYTSSVAAGSSAASGLTTITPDQACPSPVLSTDVTRVRLFSDSNGFNLSIGDDGFIRDVFLYLVRGNLTMANESNLETSFGRPGFRGVAWVNNLSMSPGSMIAVPAATNYRRNDLFAADSQMDTILDYYRDVVARAITRTGRR